MFSDKKSRGFHIDKSHLSDPARLARLLIATSMAYIWMIYLGISVIQAGRTDLIDRADRIDKSLFRLGLDWLHYLLKWKKPFSVQLSTPPCLQGVDLENVRWRMVSNIVELLIPAACIHFFQVSGIGVTMPRNK